MYQLTSKRFSGRIRAALTLVVAIVLLGACASPPPVPTAALNSAKEAIKNAEQAGARQHAGAELDEAQQKLLLAERSVSAKQMIDAERLSRESMIVAQLAVARTASAKATEINREMIRSADALNEEMQRSGDQQ